MNDRTFRFAVVAILTAILVVVIAVVALLVAARPTQDQAASVDERASPLGVARAFEQAMADGSYERLVMTMDDQFPNRGVWETILTRQPMFHLASLELVGDVTVSGPLAFVTLRTCKDQTVSGENGIHVETFELSEQPDGTWRVRSLTTDSNEPVPSCD